MSRQAIRFGLIGLAVALAALVIARRAEPERVPIGFAGHTMGTTFSVKAWLEPGKSAAALSAEAITQTLDELEHALSTWRADSEISRFNRHADTDWFPVSQHTARVVAEAQRISSLTGGALDATIAPLLAEWGFGPHVGDDQSPPPSLAKIEAALKHVGYRKLEVRLSPPALRKHDVAVGIDLSAIAKGYAVDVLAERMAEHTRDYLIEIGGELRASGTHRDQPWRVGIERPTSEKRAVQTTVALRDAALATSGDYRQFRVIDGNRVSHILDPRTGQPTDHRLAAVSVIADACMTADGLATALIVLGEKAGYDFAVRENVPALFLVRQSDGSITERATPAFEAFAE